MTRCRQRSLKTYHWSHCISAQQMSSSRLRFLFYALSSFISPTFGRNSSDLNLSACRYVDAVWSYCQSATPGFSTYSSFSSQAPCLCYESATWKPQIYDGLVSSCFDYFRTEDPSYISSISAARSRAGLVESLPTTPCSSAGNSFPGATKSANTPLITTGPSAALSRYDVNHVACNLYTTFSSLCAADTTGFSSLSFSKQASCFCYSGISWDPGYYDGLVGSCWRYISTKSTSLYSSLNVGGSGIISAPCETVGDILVSKASSPSNNPILSVSSPPSRFTFDEPSATSSGSSSSGSSSTATRASNLNTALPTPSAVKKGDASGVKVYSCSAVSLILHNY